MNIIKGVIRGKKKKKEKDYIAARLGTLKGFQEEVVMFDS